MMLMEPAIMMPLTYQMSSATHNLSMGTWELHVHWFLQVRYLSRPWISIWHCQIWSGNLQHGCAEARTNHEVNHPSCYGWYIGNIWPYHIRHCQQQKYIIT